MCDTSGGLVDVGDAVVHVCSGDVRVREMRERVVASPGADVCELGSDIRFLQARRKTHPDHAALPLPGPGMT